jgi:hypothetical protein
MRLAIPSLILFLYIFASLIWFLPCRPLVKVAAGIVLFVIGLKYLIYEKIGGLMLLAMTEPIIWRRAASIEASKDEYQSSTLRMVSASVRFNIGLRKNARHPMSFA